MSETLSRGYIDLPGGDRRTIQYNVSLPETVQLADIIRSRHCKTTAETGVAYGISTLCICAALRENDVPGALHFGIDPNQSTEYGGAALALLQQHGLESYFRLLEGPTHLEAPGLIKKGVRLDFALIDGWHTFDYTLVDVFFMDKLLRPGGVIAFHDSYGPAKRKVLRFLLSHRKYHLLPYDKVSVPKSMKEIAANILQLDGGFVYRLDRRPSLIFVEKLREWEPNYDYFRKF